MVSVFLIYPVNLSNFRKLFFRFSFSSRNRKTSWTSVLAITGSTAWHLVTCLSSAVTQLSCIMEKISDWVKATVIKSYLGKKILILIVEKEHCHWTGWCSGKDNLFAPGTSLTNKVAEKPMNLSISIWRKVSKSLLPIAYCKQSVNQSINQKQKTHTKNQICLENKMNS